MLFWHLVGQFNDKRKNKKLVVLEEVGNTVYEPKHAGKMKDMITNPTQGFNGKHKAIEDSHAVSVSYNLGTLLYSIDLIFLLS